VEAVVAGVSLEPPRENVKSKLAEPPQAPEAIAIEAEEAKTGLEPPAAAVAPAPATSEEPQPAPAPEAASSAPEPQPEPVEILEQVPASPSEPLPATEEPAPAAQPPEIVDTEASVETDPSPPAGIAADGEPSASAMLDAPPPSDPEEVNWVEVDSRTLDGTFEEARAPVAETPPASFGDPAAGARVESNPADSPRTMRRPLFRVGEVPIYDEAGFFTELKRELSKCKRVDRPLTLILIRVGDLGQIIELFGRDFREPVLWHIAEQAMETLREVDLVGMMSSKNLIAMTAFASDRYGGGRIVSRMRQAVARKPFRIGEELPPIVPALDFGMATFPADGSEVSNLLQRAEEDLTEGKDRAAVSD
jgi:diguanylate cyclase (GGDEF)-like protein